MRTTGCFLALHAMAQLEVVELVFDGKRDRAAQTTTSKLIHHTPLLSRSQIKS